MREIVETVFGFEDNETKDRIKCAFSLDEICTRDCAACTIINEGNKKLQNKAVCQRNGRENDFSIGFVIG